MKNTITNKRRSIYRKGFAATLAAASASVGSAHAAVNSLSTFSSTTSSALDNANNWLPVGTPGIATDALIGANINPLNFQISTGTSLSFGSLDVTNTAATINIFGVAGVNTTVNTITLGAGGVDGSGNLLNSNNVSGANPNDLVYLAPGTAANIRTGTGLTLTELKLSQSGIFDIGSGATLTTNNAIIGAGPLIKTGTGLLNLSTSGDTFTGGVNISSGTVEITGSGSLGTVPSVASTMLLFSGTSTAQFSGAASTNAKDNFAFSNNAVGTVDTQTFTIKFPAGITGNGSLVKIGTGILNLAAITPIYTYSGSTNVSGGMLLLNASAAIPSTPLILAGGTFQLSSGYTVTQSFPSLTLATNSSSAVVTPSFTGGSLAFGTINRATGSIVDFTLPSSGSITTTTANATNSANGPANIIGAFATVNGQTNWASSASVGGSPGAISGLATYDTTLAVPGADVDVQSVPGLSAPVSVVNSLRFNTAAALTITPSGSFTIATGGILVTSNVGAFANNISGGTLTSNSGDLIVIQGNTAGALTIASVIVDQAVNSPTGLFKAGAGNLNLAAANTFTGPTNFTAGTITLQNQFALQDTTLTSNASGTTLAFDSSVATHAFSLGGLNTAGNVSLQDNASNPVALTFGSSNLSTIVSGNISGSGSLIKVGTGLTQLRGTSSFTGGVTINAGTLQFVSSALGSNPFPITINDGGTFYYSSTGLATFASSRSINLGAGNDAIQSGGATNATNTSGTSLFVIGASGNTGGTLIGPVAGVANLAKTGLGTLQINTDSTYSGTTTVQAGILAVDSTNALGFSTLGGGYTGSGPLIINSPAGFYSQANFQVSSAAIASLSSVLAGNASAGINSLVLGLSTVGGTTALSIGADGTSTTYSGNISDLNGTFLGAKGTIVKTGVGTLTLSGTNTYAGGTNVSNGKIVLANSLALPAKSDLIIGPLGSVTANASGGAYALNLNTLTNTGLLDLTKNATVIHTGTTAAQMMSQINSAYANGAWTGTTGITSSLARTDSSHLTAIGYLVNDDGSGNALYGNSLGLGTTFDGTTPVDNDLLVKYTYYGDADLNGKVDGSDYFRIDNGFINNLSGWFNGDFNYDGIVNGSDYTLIDNAFNTQGATLAALLGSPFATSTAEIAGAAVPEPATLGLLGLGTVGLLGSRRRRNSTRLAGAK